MCTSCVPLTQFNNLQFKQTANSKLPIDMNNIVCSCVLPLQENGNFPSEYPVSCSVYAEIKASKPTLTKHRSSRYKNVGVKVFWWVSACVVQLITPISTTPSFLLIRSVCKTLI